VNSGAGFDSLSWASNAPSSGSKGSDPISDPDSIPDEEVNVEIRVFQYGIDKAQTWVDDNTQIDRRPTSA
jgi:hypothetical protein